MATHSSTLAWRIPMVRGVWRATVQSLMSCPILCDPMDCYVALQASLLMKFPRQEYQSGLPFPSPGDLPNPGIEPRSPTWQADSLPSEPPGKPQKFKMGHKRLKSRCWQSCVPLEVRRTIPCLLQHLEAVLIPQLMVASLQTLLMSSHLLL